MKYIDEYRNKALIEQWANKIEQIMPQRKISIMEVCGTHTQSFYRFGLDALLPDGLRLIAGPGCPVCVSSQGYIDNAIALASKKDVIVTTFGDMLRIPGTKSTLEREKARFGNVPVVYSPLDSLKIASLNPKKRIVFLGVGFETTAPTIALSILAAKKEKIKNIFFYSSLKLIPPVMEHLIRDPRLRLDGFLCPGHVSAVIGTKAYEFIPKRYKIPCCVAGFEPLDIMEGLYFLVKQITAKKPSVTNQYNRVVTRSGNLTAQRILKKVFKVSPAFWRGFGAINRTGLELQKQFSGFDASREFGLKSEASLSTKKTRCRCADILKGLIKPSDCPLFFKVCNPENPVGPCMVSSEGACNAYFKYKR